MNISGITKVIIDVIVYHHTISKLIIMDWSLFFILKFWCSLYYFLDIKQMLSITFYLLIDGQTKRQNNMIKTYLRVIMNWEQNN